MKRILATLIAASLLVATFAACQSDSEGGSQNDTSKENSQSTNEGNNSEGGGDSNFNETGLPIVNEPMTFTIAGVKEAVWEDVKDFKVVQKYEADTNVVFEYDLYTREAWETQKQLIAASSNKPDAFGIGNPLSQADIMDFSDQGIIIPLKELSDTYAPRFNEIMAENPLYYKSFVSLDGDFYSFPTHFDIDFGNRGDIMHFNKEWVQELRPDWEIAITDHAEYLNEDITTDEYYEYLLDVKETYPNSIPQTSAGWANFTNIYTAFGSLNNGTSGSTVAIDDSGKVYATFNTEEWKEATIYTHKLYSEGLLDPEYYTQNNDVFRAKVMEEEPIVGVANMWTGLIATPDYSDMEDIRYKNFIAAKPLVGPDGTQQWTYGAGGVAIHGSFAITTECENPEVLVRYQDYLYDEVLSLESSYGILGTGLIDNGDGTYQQIWNAEPLPENTTFNTMFITTKAMNDRVTFAPATAMTIYVADMVVKPYQDHDLAYPKFMFSSEDNARIATLKTDLEKFVKEMQSDFVVNGNIEDRWDSYLEELEKIGLSEYLEIMQENYDRYLALG